NLLVILALIKQSSLRSKSNTILGCLALTDLLTGLITQPIIIATNITLPYCYSLAIELGVTVKLLGSVSLYNVTLLNIDRYIAMKKAFRYPTIVTNERLVIAEISCWVIGLV
ncbi:predicted protein, partial [Nematostella vectensis]